MISILIGSLLANGPSVEMPLYLDPPRYDERISHAACGERVIIVRVRNFAGSAPTLTEVTIDGVRIAVPEGLSEGGLFAKFDQIDGAAIECERETGVPNIDFMGEGKRDNEWHKASGACVARGGSWLNERRERYEVIEGKLRLASTLAPVCVGGQR